MNTKLIIKKVLQEALGVPNNLYETSVNLFGRILNLTKRLSEEDYEPGVGANVVFRGKFRIADYEFSTIKVKLGVEKNKKMEEPEVVSMTVSTESQKTDDFLLKTLKSKTVKIFILILVPKKYDFEELPNFFLKNRSEIVKSLSHELKHAYDHHKRPYDRPTERALYQGVIGLGTGISVLDRFIHDIYFTAVNENLVRPSEIEAGIKDNKISQKDFLDYLRNDETYLNLKRISQFSVDNLKKEILKDKVGLHDFLKNLKFKPSKMTDEEKVQEALNGTYRGIINSTLEQYRNILTQSFLEELFGFEDKKAERFEKFVKRNSRFENGEQFFRFWEKEFRFVADQMIRKISKLYAITQGK